MNGHRYVFIGGMPRSGTSAAYQLVGTHPQVSRLTGTRVDEDEGQFLQSLYKDDVALGGPARFGLHPEAHLTEESPQAKAAGRTLFDCWAPYWDLSRPVLCEKSPGNTVRSRFLQAAFPNSSFIFVTRHPVAYALAIRKWEQNYRIPLTVTVRNWIACYRYLAEDLPHLNHALVMRYDDLASDPAAGCARLEAFLGIGPGMDASVFKSGFNDRYYRSWTARDYREGPHKLRNLVKRLWTEAEVQYVERRYEREINAFGYSFRDLYGPPEVRRSAAPAFGRPQRLAP